MLLGMVTNAPLPQSRLAYAQLINEYPLSLRVITGDGARTTRPQTTFPQSTRPHLINF